MSGDLKASEIPCVVAREKTDLSEEELDRLLDASKMTDA